MDIDQHIITEFEEKVVNHPEGFVNGNEEFKNALKDVLKMLFGLAKSLELEPFGDLPELYTDGFDAEGIWEQIRLRVEPFLDHYKRVLTDLGQTEVIESENEMEEEQEGEDAEVASEESEVVESDEDLSDGRELLEDNSAVESEEDNSIVQSDEDSDLENDEDNSEMESDEEEEKPLDDKQLWAEMQKFGDFEEEQLAKEEAGEESSEEVDLMQPIETDEEEEESEEEKDEEKRKLKRQISELEDTLLKPRSWELMGEATANKRSENELLEVDLDVDRIGATAPVSTVESTLSLEDLIKKRILDQAFDDPVRKAAPREKEKKPLEEVSTEKSTKGLGEIYEDEYMLQVHNYDKQKQELDTKKKELQVMFTRLCVALDRLSNANFTPSAAVKTLSVVSTAPALAMEEALPISVSSETQQTPEEVYKGERKVLKGESEKSQDERERERRAKKARRHAKKIRAENELHERAAYDEKARRILENRKIKESLEAKNVTKGKESSKSDDFKSTAFFKKLQDMVAE